MDGSPKTITMTLWQKLPTLLSLAASVGCMAVLVHDPGKRDADKCFSDPASWTSARIFATCMFVLFALNLRRLTAGYLAGYHPPGVLQVEDVKHPHIGSRDGGVRAVAIAFHVACLGSFIGWAANADGMHCGESTMEVAIVLAYGGFFANFALEVFIMLNVVKNECDFDSDATEAKPEGINYGHYATCAVLVPLAVAVLMRINDETAVNGTDAFDKVALIVVAFLAVVSFIQLSTEYVLRLKFSEQGMLATHKLTYAFIVTIVLLSSLTFVHMLSIKHGDHNYIAGSQRDHIKIQFWSALAAVLAGPFVQWLQKMLGGRSSTAENVSVAGGGDLAALNHPSSAGMRIGQRLSSKPKQTIELQFV